MITYMHDTCAGQKDAEGMTEQRIRFEHRHGDGSYGRLISMLDDPMISHVEIARAYNVSKEAVGQWAVKFTGARNGHKRRSVRAYRIRENEFASNRRIAAFYSAAEHHFNREDMQPYVKGDRISTRKIALKGKIVAIENACPCRGFVRLEASLDADYYFFIEGDDYYFMPGNPIRTMASRSETSKYHKFKNNFDAFEA